MIFDQKNILLPKNTLVPLVCMNSVSVSVSVIEVIVVIVIPQWSLVIVVIAEIKSDLTHSLNQ